MNTLVCSANSLLFTARCYSSGYFPIAANEPEASHIHRKQLTSTLKNKVHKEIKLNVRLFVPSVQHII